MTKAVKHVQNARTKDSREDWETPKELFDTIFQRFGFNPKLDVCATKKTTKCPIYYTKNDNALVKNWDKDWFCNPPYYETAKWIKKCSEEHWKWGKSGVALIFNHTPNMYFDYIYDLKKDRFYPHVRVYPIKSRVKFLLDGKPIRDKYGRLHNAPYDSCWVVWK